ncbi:hypothetical protein HG15A2_03750 [Adhaeretor mobilis]|uniref:Uncharacterized protein n=1 Tax=Adhaeretor mobilis TaxID=1930276 RepID=A0A517MQF4_9BACT|nr:hypothetical protein HG15A2_03750 [Adhaeretor mobilis]
MLNVDARKAQFTPCQQALTVAEHFAYRFELFATFGADREVMSAGSVVQENQLREWLAIMWRVVSRRACSP